MLTKPTRKNVSAFRVLVSLGTLFLIQTGCSSDAPAPKTQPATVSPLENKMIRRPGKNPEDAKVYVVQDGKKHWVVDAKWFATHGFRFPGDVVELPANEFDSITTGEPIQ